MCEASRSVLRCTAVSIVTSDEVLKTTSMQQLPRQYLSTYMFQSRYCMLAITKCDTPLQCNGDRSICNIDSAHRLMHLTVTLNEFAIRPNEAISKAQKRNSKLVKIQTKIQKRNGKDITPAMYDKRQSCLASDIARECRKGGATRRCLFEIKANQKSKKEKTTQIKTKRYNVPRCWKKRPGYTAHI